MTKLWDYGCLILYQSWEVFWVSITNSASNGVVSFQMAKSGALNEEMRRKAHGSSSQSEMLVTEARERHCLQLCMLLISVPQLL